jgi:hypothetical protein
MSSDLTNQNNGFPSLMNPNASDEVFDKLVRSAFLPSIRIAQGNNEMVLEGKLNPGEIAVIRNKDDFVRCGKELILVPLSMRYAAMRFDPGAVKSYFDHESAEFKQVQVDSEETNSRCAYGPQFLVWIPEQREFAHFLFGSKSSRPEARRMKQVINRPATLKARLVKNDKNSWFVPVITPYSGETSMPPTEEATEVADKFNNPGSSQVEPEFDPQNQQQATVDAGGRAR